VGTLQGGANVLNEAQNMLLGIPNAIIAAHDYLTGDTWQQLGSQWSQNLVVANDPAHNVEMGLNNAGLTGLSLGSSAIPGMVGYVGNAGNLVDAATVAKESRAIISYYPPNQGFAGEPSPASLLPGSIVDRYGGTSGSYLSPRGTPAWARALPFRSEAKPLSSFEVLKPIEVNAGVAAPWFNQPGGGIQYDLGTRTVQDLIDSGHLRPIP
jgi:hypothetical protein